jgi:hypothetical protein
VERLAEAFAQLCFNTVQIEALLSALPFDDRCADVIRQATPQYLVNALSSACRQALARRFGHAVSNSLAHALAYEIRELLLPSTIACFAEPAAGLRAEAAGELRTSGTDRAHRRLNRLVQLLNFMCRQCHDRLLPSE